MIERLTQIGGAKDGGDGRFDAGFNILRDDPAKAVVRAEDGSVFRCWSGWFGERALEDGTEPDISRWLPSTLGDLEGACARFLASHPGATLLLRNHHRHALHDHHTLMRFATRWQGGEHAPGVRSRLGFILDPAAWLTAQMIPDAEDHLQRVADQMQREPLNTMVREIMLTGLAVPSGQNPLSGEKLGVDVGPAMRPVPLGDAASLLDAAMVRRVYGPVTQRGVRIWELARENAS